MYRCVIYFCFSGCFWLTPSSIPASLSSGVASHSYQVNPGPDYKGIHYLMAPKAKPKPTGNRWNTSRWSTPPASGVTLFQALGIKKGTVHFKQLQTRLPAQVAQSQRQGGSGASSGGSGLPKGGNDAANAKLGQAMAAQKGWTGAQWTALNNIAMAESGWNASADNPSSGAWGIPQALPGSKMASAGADWKTNPRTQIAWMLEYIRSRYGTPERAWQFHLANGWY